MGKKCWYVHHGSTPEFIEFDNKRVFDENLYISSNPSITVLYNIDKGSPNPYLQQFGYVFSNIPGDMILIYDNKNVPENIEELLPTILKKDNDDRLEFFNSMEALNCNIISF